MIYIAVHYRRIGMVPLCCQLNSCDVGEIVDLEGVERYISWGANLTAEDVEQITKNGWCGDFVKVGKFYEHLLPKGPALKKILKILYRY